MEKAPLGLLGELHRSAHALLSRLRDPSVIVLMLAAFAAALAFTRQEARSERRCIVEAPQNGTGAEPASRFLIPAYAMPGPIAFENLSPQAQREFTLDGKTPVKPWLTNDEPVSAPVWSRAKIERFVKLADGRDPHVGTELCPHGEDCNEVMFEALKAHPIQGMNVLVVGSVNPWVEAICLSFRANSTTTVDFTPPIAGHPRVFSLSIPELESSPQLFDAVFSYSFLAHDGLGRYGDPLNPFGDFERMKKFRGLLRPGGKLYLGIPNGPEFLLFNAHRVYGQVRFPMLTHGWKLLGTYGEVLEDTYKGIFKSKPWCMPKGLPDNQGCFTQPLHVLTENGE